MTDHSRDELLSAALDGEVTPADRARIDADPELVERLRQLADARDAVAAPIDPPGTEIREAMIANALQQLHVPGPTPGTEAAAGADELTARRARSRRRLNIVAAAAAAVVLVGGVGAALRAIDDDGDDDSMSTSAALDAGEAASTDDGADVNRQERASGEGDAGRTGDRDERAEAESGAQSTFAAAAEDSEAAPEPAQAPVNDALEEAPAADDPNAEQGAEDADESEADMTGPREPVPPALEPCRGHLEKILSPGESVGVLEELADGWRIVVRLTDGSEVPATLSLGCALDPTPDQISE